jgi:DNA helicase-2/ATP-dependent DNA helicase PcrA
MEDRYLEHYGRLNAAQREAVDAIEGPVMVIAGPGTGKTQILTLRIANILRNTDTAPGNILALTFTEAGARAMRERLFAYIGAPAYNVEIHTFHEFAGTLIRAYPDAYDRAVGGRPATDLEKVEFIEGILETGGIRLLRPRGNPSFYIPSILGAIALMKREYITPDHLSARIDAQEASLAAMPKFHEKGAHTGKVRSEYQKFEKEILKNRELLCLSRIRRRAYGTASL